MIDYNNRKFAGVENTENGQVSGKTIFHYQQQGNVVWGNYTGGEITRGSLVALADDQGRLNMRYQHVDNKGNLKTGECQTTPEVLPDGRLRLHEKWRWTSGDHSEGSSIVEELPPDRAGEDKG